jgi:diguanylate cyclase (GGDEF)-like protein
VYLVTQRDKRHSDHIRTGPRKGISTLAFMLAGLLIAVTAASLLFVGFVASQASGQQAIKNEKRLFQNTLVTQMDRFLREQMTVSRLDDSVRHIVRDFDYDFVGQQIENLWRDYRHSRVLIVDDSNRVLAESFEDYTHITNRPLRDTPAYVPLVEKARVLFSGNRVRIPGGYSHRSLQSLELTDYAAVGFAVVDGNPALVGALPIIPDQDKVTLPSSQPTILVTAKFIDGKMLADLNAQLSFADLSFEPGAFMAPETPAHLIRDVSDSAIGTFVWRSQAVDDSMSIWQTVVPVVLILSLLLAILAFGIAWRIGRLTNSLQASEKQNRYLALHDPLSGLANRLQFNRALETAVEKLPHTLFAVIQCDLDKFKQVNDTLGHAAGDTVIITVSERLREIVGDGGLVARLGGDEFVILFSAFTDRGRLTLLCGRMLNAIAQPIPLGNGKEAEVGLSIGVATAPDCGNDPEALMVAADEALYHSKENGRGQAAFARDMAHSLKKTPRNGEKAGSRPASDAA